MSFYIIHVYNALLVTRYYNDLLTYHVTAYDVTCWYMPIYSPAATKNVLTNHVTTYDVTCRHMPIYSPAATQKLVTPEMCYSGAISYTTHVCFMVVAAVARTDE